MNTTDFVSVVRSSCVDELVDSYAQLSGFDLALDASRRSEGLQSPEPCFNALEIHDHRSKQLGIAMASWIASVSIGLPHRPASL